MNLVDDGGLQAAEAHVVLAVHVGHGQLVRLGVAVPCRRGHAGAAGVGQTQRAGDLVVGLARGVVNEVHKAEQKGQAVNVADMAASFQERIDQILAKKLLAAAADTNARQVVLAGGVAANGRLRQLVNDGAQKLGAKIFLPELKYCGDNGAMIAAQGYYEFQDGNLADWSLNGLPTLPIDYR